MIGYTILIGLALMTLVSLFSSDRRFDCDFCLAPWRPLLITTLGALMVGVILIRTDYHGQIARHHEIAASLERARSEQLSPLERAAVQSDVIKYNARLRYHQAQHKYWAPFIPGAVMDVEPIQ